MLEPTKVTVNGRNYTVNPLSPVEAYEFHHSRLKAFRNGESLFPHGMRAIGQCLDGMLNKLSDNETFRKVFSQYPEDLLPLQGEAVKALLGPFWMKEENTSGNDENS